MTQIKINLNGTFLSDNLSNVYSDGDGKERAHTIANLFCSLSSELQAEFFDSVYNISAKWKKPSCFQWNSMANDLSKHAKTVIEEMYECAHSADVGDEAQ